MVASSRCGTPLNAVEALGSLDSAAGTATLRKLCDKLALEATSAVLYGKPATVLLALQTLLTSKVLCAQHCRQESAFCYLDGSTLR